MREAIEAASRRSTSTSTTAAMSAPLTSLGGEPPGIEVWAYARESGRERLERVQD